MSASSAAPLVASWSSENEALAPSETTRSTWVLRSGASLTAVTAMLSTTTPPAPPAVTLKVIEGVKPAVELFWFWSGVKDKAPNAAFTSAMEPVTEKLPEPLTPVKLKPPVTPSDDVPPVVTTLSVITSLGALPLICTPVMTSVVSSGVVRVPAALVSTTAVAARRPS
ncbi:hypothetical protein D9M68_761230 [compost metagenome]